MPIGADVLKASPGPLVRKSPFRVTEPFAPFALLSFLNLAWVKLMEASLPSQTLPRPSLSRSCCPGLLTVGQLSSVLQIRSPSGSPPPPSTQVPAWQVSETVHVSGAAAQMVPFDFGVFTQAPLGSAQAAVLHWSPRQTTGVPVWQLPATQVSVPLQASPSLQSAGLLQLTQAGADVATGAGVAGPGPETVSQPAAFGPPTAPPQVPVHV